ncbi:hypothetical protein E0G74_01450 [Salmonella enterica]|nr:hypothetical protein [Salmonella enterica]
MGTKYCVTVHGWKAWRLTCYTFEQLNQLQTEVELEHINPRNERGCYVEDGQETIHLYDKRGRRKLDAISWAVYHKMKARKPLPHLGFQP